MKAQKKKKSETAIKFKGKQYTKKSICLWKLLVVQIIYKHVVVIVKRWCIDIMMNETYVVLQESYA